MKTSLVVSTVVLGLFTASCIALPSLSDEQKTLAGFIGDTACVAAAQKGTGLSEEGKQKMIEEYGEDLMTGFAESPAAKYLQDESKVEALTKSFEENPLLAGIFVQEVVTSVQSKCGLEEGGEGMEMISSMFGEMDLSQ